MNDDTLTLEVIEIYYMQYRSASHPLSPGVDAKLVPAYAMGMNGRVVISSHSKQPDWSFDRAEIERRIEALTPERDEQGEYIARPISSFPRTIAKDDPRMVQVRRLVESHLNEED